jgi:murein DD-endopeptidase MepM/ murein hydrolase activator NlpD
MLSGRIGAGTRSRPFQLQLSLAIGQRTRTLVLPPAAVVVFMALLPLAGLIYLGATCYYIFHDDLLARLTQRQIAMQYSYEDRLAVLRHEITNLTQHAKINAAEVAERVNAISQRQGELESRTLLVARLAERAKAMHQRSTTVVTASIPDTPKPDAAASINPLLTEAFAPELPAGTSAYAPLGRASAPPNLPTLGDPKPHPEGFQLRLNDTAHAHGHAVSEDGADRAASQPAGARLSPLSLDFGLPLTNRLDRLSARQDQLDHAQLALLHSLRKPAERISARIRSAIATAGLSAAQLRLPAGALAKKGSTAEATGGPFVPLPTDTPDNAAFARAATETQNAIATAERLRLVESYVPLAAPLPDHPAVTSPFGSRIDPFFGRPALHTGVDLRENYGAPVRATANGTVVFASADGGYGNMVEIDHGNGLTTRYAHLSRFEVRPGQKVKAGTIVGRIGTTGRTTGPHLHYETRIDGTPVDPERFLKAGARLRMAEAGQRL